MSGAQQLLAGGSSSSVLYSDDVFLSYLRSGTGASASITAGFKPDLVWTKARSAATGHRFTDSSRGVTKSLDSSSTAAEATEAQGLTSFDTSGYTIGTDTDYNNSTGPVTYVDWAFKKAAKFFDVVTYTGNGTTQTINHSLGQAPGMVVIKYYSGTNAATSDWVVWHRSTTSGRYLYLNSTLAEQTSNAVNTFGNNTITVDPTSTNFTVGSRILANDSGGTFVAYLFAHDTATDGIIQCGSYTGNGSTSGPTVTLGWEPQFVLAKMSSGAEDWWMMDVMRGMYVPDTSRKELFPDLANAENSDTGGAMPTATGFQVRGTNTRHNTNGSTYIYLAIRRPNKPPTSGTQVFTPYKGTGSGTKPFWKSSHVADALFGYALSGNAAYPLLTDRLRGAVYSSTSGTAAETSDATFTWDYMNGAVNVNDLTTFAGAIFKRAPGVFDVVCYTSNGSGGSDSQTHALGVTPELVINKARGVASDWISYASGLTSTNYQLVLNTTAAQANRGSSWITLGTSTFQITNGELGFSKTYVAYLFATKAGISKVGSYTGNGSSQTINCGFAAGARFILIKRTDSTGDWYVYDTVRTYPAGNDYSLKLNSTAAEASSSDDVDYDATGFIVNQNATTNLNVNTATYIFLCFA